VDVRHRQRGEELLRIRPRENPAVNRWWMCDEGRFTFRYLSDPARLRVPTWREGDRPVEMGYDDLLLRLARAIRRVMEAYGPMAFGCIASSRLTNEELFLVRRFFREILDTPHLDFRVRQTQFQETDASEDGILRRTDKTANSRGARDLGILPGPEGTDLVTDTTMLAHVVLPALGFAEKEGSFTNFQGRIQKIHRALTPHVASRSLPEALRDLAWNLGRDLGAIQPERVWAAIGETPGTYQGIAWKDIERLGLMPEPRA
jgi:predicted molibdopterin-dependent oxidoreductase YjgC